MERRVEMWRELVWGRQPPTGSRFNEITYFLEFTFEVGGSWGLPRHAVIHAKILTGINRENFAVKN